MAGKKLTKKAPAKALAKKGRAAMVALNQKKVPVVARAQGVTKAPVVVAALAPITDALPLTELPPSALEVSSAVTTLGAQVNLFKFEAATAVQGQEMLTQLAGLRKRLDAERKKLVKPIKDKATRIEALFKPVTTKLEAFDAALRAKYLTFIKEQQVEREAAQRQLIADAQRAQDSGDHDSALALSTQAAEASITTKTAVVDTGSVQTKLVWDFKVIDLGAVPEEYKTLDETKVRAAIRAGLRDTVTEEKDGLGGTHTVTTPAIPGIAIFQRDTLAVTAS
jgi:hypothetical protein